MPPQQPERLLDLIDQGLDFRAHRVAAFAPVLPSSFADIRPFFD